MPPQPAFSPLGGVYRPCAWLAAVVPRRWWRGGARLFVAEDGLLTIEEPGEPEEAAQRAL